MSSKGLGEEQVGAACSTVTDLANAWDLADRQGVHETADGAVLTRNCILPIRLLHVSGHLHQADVSRLPPTAIATATTKNDTLDLVCDKEHRRMRHLGQQAVGAYAAGTCQPRLFADPPPYLRCHCLACAMTEPFSIPIGSQQLSRQQHRIIHTKNLPQK